MGAPKFRDNFVAAPRNSSRPACPYLRPILVCGRAAHRVREPPAVQELGNQIREFEERIRTTFG
jgi:hypothetical protein